MFRGILLILGPSYSWLWRIGTFSMCRWRWRSRSYCRFRGLFSINSNLLHLEDTAWYQWNKGIPKAIARAYLTDSIRGSGYTSSTQWYESPKQVTLPPFGITYFFALGHLIVRHGSASGHVSKTCWFQLTKTSANKRFYFCILKSQCSACADFRRCFCCFSRYQDKSTWAPPATPFPISWTKLQHFFELCK